MIVLPKRTKLNKMKTKTTRAKKMQTNKPKRNKANAKKPKMRTMTVSDPSNISKSSASHAIPPSSGTNGETVNPPSLIKASTNTDRSPDLKRTQPSLGRRLLSLLVQSFAFSSFTISTLYPSHISIPAFRYLISFILLCIFPSLVLMQMLDRAPVYLSKLLVLIREARAARPALPLDFTSSAAFAHIFQSPEQVSDQCTRLTALAHCSLPLSYHHDRQCCRHTARCHALFPNMAAGLPPPPYVHLRLLTS
jgi:hypothetical protein